MSPIGAKGIASQYALIDVHLMPADQRKASQLLDLRLMFRKLFTSSYTEKRPINVEISFKSEVWIR